MQKLFSAIIIIFICTSSFAQYSLKKLWESDSITLKGPESATYDPSSKRIYISSMNNGSIVQMDLNGKIIKNDWVNGLSSNKGFGFHKGMLYNAETSSVAVIDIKKGTIVKRIPVEGAVMLNDLDVNDIGIVYVSDTRAGKVYKIEQDQVSLYLQNIPGANGILTVDQDVYVAGTNTFQKVNANKEITFIGDGYENGLDGIVKLNNDGFILSNYRGMIYYVSLQGEKQILLDTREIKIMANDISFDHKSNTLFVPSFATNRIIAYKLVKENK
jgi:sugar lactone lactonase YvrE